MNALVRHRRRLLAIAALCAVAGCSATPQPQDAASTPAGQVGRPALDETQARGLQSSIMALADTSIQRISSELHLGRSSVTPEARRDDMTTRLTLASALVTIAMEPNPVDGLADLLTHTTLAADAQRTAAKGKPADSPEARLLRVLEQNEADAWQLAERWVNEPTRVAFRARILAWPGPRPSAASVSFVRLSDLKRGGSTAVNEGDGMFDSLRAATQQIDEARLLAERSLFLAQRMPFLVRWQAEVYTGNALATKEAQETQVQLQQMSAIMASAANVLAGMTAQLSRERAAALDDLFTHIENERKALLEQVQGIVRTERASALEQTNAIIDGQRKAVVDDLNNVANSAGRTGTAWVGRILLIGTLLIVLLLVGLLGTMLLYRRLVPRYERR